MLSEFWCLFRGDCLDNKGPQESKRRKFNSLLKAAEQQMQLAAEYVTETAVV